MSGSRILLDTNIFIADLSGQDPTLYHFLERHNVVVSVITKIELLGYHGLTTDEELMMREILEHVEIVPLSEGITETTISLKRKYKIKTPDCIIASTAIHENIPLVTRDKQLFNIKEVITFTS